MKTFLNIVFGVLIGLLAAGVIWLAASRPRGEPVVLLPTPTPGVLTVYVSGRGPGGGRVCLGRRAGAYQPGGSTGRRAAD